jgi:hypothetical protein
MHLKMNGLIKGDFPPPIKMRPKILLKKGDSSTNKSEGQVAVHSLYTCSTYPDLW